MKKVLVIDIGGTKTNVSLVTGTNTKIKILDSDVFPTNKNPELEIKEINSIYTSMNKQANDLSLSLPGKWNKDGVLKESLFLSNWIEYPFIKKLSDNLKIKNYVWETDVICGALGEYHTGKFQNGSMLYINLGTGISAALIKNGKPFKDPKLTLRLQKMVFSSGEKLYSAIDIISKSPFQLASWLINLYYLFAPDVIVLNGGLTYDWDVLASKAARIAKEKIKNDIKILPSKLKELAPIYGAYLNRNNFF
ncbi:MAG: ROK family protein [Candidatus Melainabacteria bacterium]|nr:ROK family protein [Candidatus Melainabacteria bacterium]